jgi:hypothetical protein
MSEPTAKTVLRAVVRECRNELRLTNPDLRRVGLMLADGLEALAQPAERTPEPIDIRAPDALETRSRSARRAGRRVE